MVGVIGDVANASGSSIYDVLSSLSGTALAIATLLFFIRYLIGKEDVRETQFSKILEANTAAVQQNTQVTVDLKDAIQRIGK